MPKAYRYQRLEIRLTADERALAQTRASEAGLTVSELFRASTLKHRLPRRVSDIAFKTYWELGKIGVNLNQLAKAANTAIKLGQAPPADPGELERLEGLLQRIRQEILDVDTLAEEEGHLVKAQTLN